MPTPKDRKHCADCEAVIYSDLRNGHRLGALLKFWQEKTGKSFCVNAVFCGSCRQKYRRAKKKFDKKSARVTETDVAETNASSPVSNDVVPIEEEKDCVVPEPLMDLLINQPIEIIITEEKNVDVQVAPLEVLTELTPKKALCENIYRKYELEIEDCYPENEFVKFYIYRENEQFKKQTRGLAEYRKSRGDAVVFHYAPDPMPKNPFDIEVRGRKVLTSTERMATFKMPQTVSPSFVFRKYSVAEGDRVGGNTFVQQLFHQENDFRKTTADFITRYKRMKLRVKDSRISRTAPFEIRLNNADENNKKGC